MAPTHRLAQVDALRGLAALAVVLFHYTTRFADLFHGKRPWIEVPWGPLGVNLFFIVSGFVIFMTLDRLRRPMDFVVSRASRLFPAYWVAIALTATATNLLGLPAEMNLPPLHILANLSMVQGLFGIPSVDGVYWTLLVELQFYVLMFAAWSAGWLPRLHQVLWALLALRSAEVMAQWLGHDGLPWRVQQLLILKHLPWFALGIAVFQSLHADRFGPHWKGVAALAIASLLLGSGWPLAAIALGLTVLVRAAAAGRLRMLDWRPLTWLGGISYPLYLLHENIGWGVMLQLTQRGLDLHAAIAGALTVSLLLSQAVHRFVELPAMGWARKAWRQRAVTG